MVLNINLHFFHPGSFTEKYHMFSFLREAYLAGLFTTFFFLF